MDFINVFDLHLLEGVHGAMRLDFNLTYKLLINLSRLSREL